MAKQYTPAEVKERMFATLREGKPVVIGGAGDGFTAKLEEKGGVDIIGIYNSGRFRHFGAGSLCGLMPMGRNNDMVVEYADEVLSQVKQTPVIAGFCAQDPRTLWPQWFKYLAERGCSGFMNFPTVGLIDADSHYRANLEESGLGYDKEVAILKLCHRAWLLHHRLLLHTQRSAHDCGCRCGYPGMPCRLDRRRSDRRIIGDEPG